MCDDNLEDSLMLPQEAEQDDGDAARLMLQHCGMPPYQFVIQVAPDQTMVTTAVNLCCYFPIHVVWWAKASVSVDGCQKASAAERASEQIK